MNFENYAACVSSSMCEILVNSLEISRIIRGGRITVSCHRISRRYKSLKKRSWFGVHRYALICEKDFDTFVENIHRKKFDPNLRTRFLLAWSSDLNCSSSLYNVHFTCNSPVCRVYEYFWQWISRSNWTSKECVLCICVFLVLSTQFIAFHAAKSCWCISGMSSLNAIYQPVDCSCTCDMSLGLWKIT